LKSNAQIIVSVNDIDETPLNGLVANYKFNGNWDDYSGNNFHADSTGTVFSTDRFNSANQSLQFNGLSDYLTLPSDFDYQNKSISLWFNATVIPVYDYLNNPNNSWGALITCDYPNLQFGSLNLGVTNIDGTDKIFFYEGGMDTKVNPNLLVTPINKNEWHHIVLTLSDQIVKFYLDGNLINSYKSAFLNSVNGNPNMMIGTSRGATARYYKGKIDDLLIYNRILTAEEVSIISKE
jgi:hypothetical protein